MDNSLDKNISTGFLLKFALPSIIIMVFSSIYSIIDGIFVSNLIGTDALSAVNIIMPVITFTIAIGTMMSTGGNAIIAKKMGEKNSAEARSDFSLIIVIAISMSIVFCIIAFIFNKPLLGFLGANDAIYKYCYEYLIPTLIFLPFTLFAILFQTFFITAGKAHLGLIFSVVGGVSNIFLDYLLIKVMNIGIAGAAIATGIGYSIPGILGLLYFILQRKGSLYLVKPKFNFDTIKNTCINGSSEMVSTLSAGIVTLLLNNILMKMAGSDGVASITVILYVQMLLSAIYMGYSIGTAPLISFNYGKGDDIRLKRIYSISLKSISIFSIAVFIFGLTQTNVLVSLFVNEGTEVYNLASSGFKLFSFSFLFMGINIFASSLFTAFSNGKVSAILSFLRTLVFVVVLLLVLPTIIGVTGVWIAIPLAELLALIVSIYNFRKFKCIYNY